MRRPFAGARAVAVAAALVVAVLVAFSPLRQSGFLNFDDDRNLTQNSRVSASLSAAGARWALVSMTGGNWHPLTWVSHQLDWSLFKEKRDYYDQWVKLARRFEPTITASEKNVTKYLHMMNDIVEDHYNTTLRRDLRMSDYLRRIPLAIARSSFSPVG